MQTDTMFSSASADHYTPLDIIERARAVLQGIDLDPASSAKANATVQAIRYYYDPYSYDEQTANGSPGGLDLSWECRTLWLNPPFSIEKRSASGMIVLKDGKSVRQRVIDQWVSRWRAATHIGTAKDGAMLLVPARTDTEWFQPLFGLPMCFVSGRLKFGDADNGTPFPTMIAYAGPLVDRFYLLFEEIGVCGRFAR